MWRALLKHESSSEPLEVAVQRVTSMADGVLSVRCGEAPHEVRFEGRPGGGVLHMHGRVVPFYAAIVGDQVDVWMGGNVYRFDVEPQTGVTVGRAGAVARGAARAGTAGRAGAHALATDEIAAPMPGTVLKVNVSAGDAFAAHKPLLVLESMKMEMALSAPVDGRVREVRCRPGELVQMGQVLLKLDLPE